MRFALGGQYGLTAELGRTSVSEALCTCGHERAAHEHLRRGMDCGSCGRDICRAFAVARRAKRTNVIPFERRPARPVPPAAQSAKAG